MSEKVTVGLLGLGVVGSGVIKLIENHQQKLAHQLNCNVRVKRVLVRNLEKSRDVDIEEDLLTTNPDDVLNDPEIDVVVEVMGGIDEAKDYILKAFASNKHVVSANKDLVALHGPELQDAATRNKCDFFYEASVAGGIPILRGIVDGLASDRIGQVMGIVNGTTNYILTQMDSEGVSYENALNEAQKLGFAEADPTSDVEGLDAARKMAILGRLAFSTPVDLDDVEVSGIKGIELEDLQYGDKLGYTMKLIGYANFDNHELEINVQPTLLAKTHPLASVKNEFNAVYVYGEAVGETMFYGPGAGSLPTATAIVSDVVSVIKNMRLGVSGNQFVEPHFKKELKAPDKRYAQYYVRLYAKDEAGVFSNISALFHDQDISFKRILQTPVNKDEVAEIIFITHQTSLQNFQHALEKLKGLDAVLEVKSYYKVEGDAIS
ncbi:homoserine dehydrogenase [Oceanobacillus profundus]|uniref:homoserine dehydrogenase n=1 Tax=Oceanobacillus TaxID=182709 RepID=UPI000BA71334|nr:homoserine dehydrogenase [Oceanobacillus profundus]MCM3398896.1 homoserine dehydrogenase [Oceanobacillus profundus]MDO6451656.1 homoserine dehydrogenase [Oceanobacillus profundus]PAE28535.1 homoserine dehydrogenase [Paenibacillus sp. 7884-2]